MRVEKCGNKKIGEGKCRKLGVYGIDENSLAFIYSYSKKAMNSGGARGGLGGHSPPSEHASPRRKVKSDFSEIFGIYSTLKAIF